MKENREPIHPISKWLLGIVLALGFVLIVADTGINQPQLKTPRVQQIIPSAAPKPTQPGDIPVWTGTAGRLPVGEEVLGETQPPETEPTEAVTLPPAEETAPSLTVPGSEGPVAYEILRWDRSYTNDSGKKQMTYYYDYPVLQSQELAHERINEALYRKAEAFMSEMTQEQIETPVMSVFNTPTDCIYTVETEVFQNGEGALSLLYTSVYYMGGNHSIKNRHAATYSLKTGDEVTLRQLTELDPGVLLKELQSRAFEGIAEKAGNLQLTDTKAVLEQYTLEDFRFVIQEGEIVLLFDTYQFTAGVAGPQMIPTGLYIAGANMDS